MNTHLVSYDLRQPGRNYDSLHEHLKAYGTWAKPLESLWLIKTELDADSVLQAAKLHVDLNDELLVIDVTGDGAAWRGLDKKVSDWIQNNL